MTFEIKNTISLQLDTVTGNAANYLSTTARSLKGAKLRLAKLFGPIRCEHAMSSASYRVFRNTFCWSKVAANKVITVISGGGNDHSWTADPS